MTQSTAAGNAVEHAAGNAVEHAVPPQVGRNVIVFTGGPAGYHGTGLRGREWSIAPSMTGWLLRFRDPGDDAWTYAGTHPTLQHARAEASR